MELNLLIISIVEGITEFLPISSTAHIIFLSKILTVDLSSPYIKFYLLVIQLGALLAGIFLFSKKVLFNKKLFINITISFIPSAVIGYLLYQTFKKLLEGNLLLMSFALFLGGIIFIYLEKFIIKNEDFGKEEMTKTDALLVGIAQSIAIIPGVSRSGATIIAGVLRGIKKATIIEYTFMLALPTLGAAVIYDFYKTLPVLYGIQNHSSLYIGTFISFLVSLITLYLIKTHLTKISLSLFGIYRVILSLIILLIYFF